MENELLRLPLWMWGLVALVVAAVLIVFIARAIVRARRRPGGSLRRRLTPAPFRVFLSGGESTSGDARDDPDLAGRR